MHYEVVRWPAPEQIVIMSTEKPDEQRKALKTAESGFEFTPRQLFCHPPAESHLCLR